MSFPADFICLPGRVGGANSNFHPLIMRSPDGMHHVSCWSASAANYFLDLLPESLADKSVNNRVNSRIEQDHYGTCFP